MRRIAAHVTGDDRPAARSGPDDLAAALETLNADAATCAPVLELDETGRPRLRRHPGPRDADRSRAELALAAARLFGGPDAELLRAATAPVASCTSTATTHGAAGARPAAGTGRGSHGTTNGTGATDEFARVRRAHRHDRHEQQPRPPHLPPRARQHARGVGRQLHRVV